MIRSRFALTALVAATLVVGCSSSDADRIKLVPVDGVVTINGQPFPGAAVVFTPQDSGEGVTSGSDTTGPRRSSEQGEPGAQALGLRRDPALHSRLAPP